MQNQTIPTMPTGDQPEYTVGLRLALKAFVLVYLINPLIALNSFLFFMADLKAVPDPNQTIKIEWGLLPEFLLESMLRNALGLPISFIVAVAMTYGAARLLGGSGRFWHHGYALAMAYLKSSLIALPVMALSTAFPELRCLLALVFIVAFRWLSMATSNEHHITPIRGFVALLPTILIVPVGLGLLLFMGVLLSGTF